jgi:transcriptional regulator of aromatic amino acid metabolism
MRTVEDTSAFSQILAVGPKMRHVVEQARKLAMLSAPLFNSGALSIASLRACSTTWRIFGPTARI